MGVTKHSGGDTRKHVYSKRRKLQGGRVAKLERQVKDLRADTNIGISNLTARSREVRDLDVTRATAGNDQISASYVAFDRGLIERGVEKVSMWNDETNNWVVGDIEKLGGDDIDIVYRSSEITIKNFQPNDCNVTIRLCVAKGSVDQLPINAWQNGVVDTTIPSAFVRIGLNSLYDRNVQSYPSDSKLFNSSYNVVGTHTEKLNPGETLKWKMPSHLSKDFKYDFQHQEEAEANTVMKGSMYWLVTVDGGIMRDSVLGHIQNGTAGVGVVIENTIKIRYNSGGLARDSVAYIPRSITAGASGADGGAVFANTPEGITHGGNVHQVNVLL